MTKPSKESMVNTVIALITCALMVFGGVWHAGAQSQKTRDAVDKLDQKVKDEIQRKTKELEETKADVKEVKQEVVKVNQTCNDIKREQAVQALEQKHIKESQKRMEDMLKLIALKLAERD